MRSEAGLQRLQPPHCSANPVGEGRAIKLDALPGEDLALLVEGKMIAVFGDQHMRKQAGRGQALGDWPLRSRRLMDRAAGLAAVARTADTDDPQPGGNMVEHLADRLADQVECTAAAGAGLMHKIDPDIFASQMRRQARPIIRRLGCNSLLWSWREPGLGPRQIGVEVLESELQLIVVEPLGASPELGSLQLLDDEMQPFDLRLRRAETGALGCKRAHQFLQRLNIIRQGGKIDVHEGEE